MVRAGYEVTGYQPKSEFQTTIRSHVGAWHRPLAETVNTFLESGFRLIRLTEIGPAALPSLLGITVESHDPARKESLPMPAAHLPTESAARRWPDEPLAKDLARLRETNPLTNLVVTGFTANVLLAVGASPAMVIAAE